MQELRNQLRQYCDRRFVYERLDLAPDHQGEVLPLEIVLVTSQDFTQAMAHNLDFLTRDTRRVRVAIPDAKLEVDNDYKFYHAQQLRYVVPATSRILQSLIYNHTLAYLNLHISDATLWSDLNTALSHNHNLQELDVSTNVNIARLECLAHNQTLTTVTICFRDKMICDTSLEAIRQALAYNQTLTSLSLMLQRVEAEGLKAIAHMVRNNNYIRHLSIGCDSASPVQRIGSALMENLVYNQSVEYLHFSANNEPIRLAEDLSYALRHNRTLQHLSLHAVALDNASYRALADVMDRCCLSQFSCMLLRPDIAADAATFIRAAAQSQLQRLTIGQHTDLTREILQAIAYCIANSDSLLKLVITAKSVPEEVIPDVVAAIAVNCSLQDVCIGIFGEDFQAPANTHDVVMQHDNLRRVTIGDYRWAKAD